MTEGRRFRWYQFSIRALLALMLLCAVGLTVFLRYVGPFRHERHVDSLVARLGGTVHSKPADVGWIARYFDDGYFSHINYIQLAGTRVTDADLHLVHDLPYLTGLDLRQTNIGDGGVNGLSDLPKLVALDLNATRVTDDGVRSLRKFSGLQCLSLANTAIGDDSSQTIGQLRHLEELNLHGTRFTDTGMTHVAQVKSLKWLCLSGTGITDAGLEKLAGLESLKSLEIANTGVTEASMSVLVDFPNLTRVDVEGARILPATFRRYFPELANQSVYGNTSGFSFSGRTSAPRKLNLNDATYLDALEHLSDHYQLTIVPSYRAAQVLKADDGLRLTASVQGPSYSDTLRKFFMPHGVRPIVRYSCVQLITIDDSVREPCRMIVHTPDAVSQRLCQRLYGGCPPLDGLYRNQLLAQSQPAHILAMIPRYYTWRLEDLTAAMQDLGLKTELDEAAFTDHPELLTRQISVPTRWRASLSAALESMFDLLDVHGVIKDDTILIRPGAAPE